MPACRRTELYCWRTLAGSARRVAGSRTLARCGHSALTWPNSDPGPGLVGGRAGAAEVLVDGAQGHELAGGSGGHLRAVVAHGQKDRPCGVVAGQVDGAVQAGGDQVDQPLGLQGLAEGGLDLEAGLLDRDDLAQPLSRHQVLDRADRHPGAGEVGRVEDPQHPGPVLHPVGERLAHAACRPWQRPQPQTLASKDPTHAGRRHPDPGQIRATVGELAMGAVDLAHWWNSSATSSASSPWTAPPPGRRSSNWSAAARSSHRQVRRGPSSSAAHAARTVQPRSTASSSKASRPALVTASTLGGTRPLSPNALFPPPAAA
jgi:hypothetical protein